MKGFERMARQRARRAKMLDDMRAALRAVAEAKTVAAARRIAAEALAAIEGDRT